MKEFRLDSQTIVQLLGDPEFFAANAAFLFMRESSLAAVAKYQQAVLKKEKNCDDCGGSLDESTYVTGSIASFVSIVHQLKDHADQHPIEQLREYITKKLGFHPDVVIMYYKLSSEMTKVEF